MGLQRQKNSSSNKRTRGGIGEHSLVKLVKGLFRRHLDVVDSARILQRGSRSVGWGRGSRRGLVLGELFEEVHDLTREES